MQRVLILSVVIALFLMSGTLEGFAQENKPITPEQRIEKLTNDLLSFKYNLAEEKRLCAIEKNLAASEMKITVQLQIKVMKLEKQIKELLEKLKQSNAKIARLEMGTGEGR